MGTTPFAPRTLEERIDRLESIDAIRQLAGKYSLSLDMRDMDAHVNLFAPDIRVGKDKVGRAHFKAWQDDTLRDQFTGTSHHLGQHIIEFVDADHATGVVYSKNGHENALARARALLGHFPRPVPQLERVLGPAP